MSKLFKRIISIALVLLCILSTLPVIEVSAASSTASWGYSGIYACKTSTVAYDGDEHIMLYADSRPAYCIQPGHHYNESTKIVKNTSETWNALNRNIKTSIYLAMLYGAEGNINAMNAEISGLTYNQAYVATQILIWEFVLGERTPTAPYKLASGKAGYISTFCDGGNNPNVQKAYDFIVDAMSDFYKTPSFTAEVKSDADTHYLQAVKQSNGTWNFVGDDIVLTDNNNVLADYNLTKASIDVGNGVLKTTQSGNKLTISGVSVNSNGTAKLGVISAQRKTSSLPSGGEGRLIAYGSDTSYVDEQDVVTMIFDEDEEGFYPSADPPYVYLNVGLNLSKAERDFYIQKVCKAVDSAGNTTNLNDEESLSGWYFTITLPKPYSGAIYIGPTDSTGKTITISEAIQANAVYGSSFDINNVPAGTYTIRERGKKNSDGEFYFPDGWSSPYSYDRTTFTLSEDSGMSEVANFRNNYEIPIQIKKVFEDGNGGTKPYYFMLTSVSGNIQYLLKNNSNGYLTVVKSTSGHSYENSENSMYLQFGSYYLSEWGQLKSGVAEGNTSISNYVIPDRYTKVTNLPVVISATELNNAIDAGYDTIYVEAVNIVSHPIAVIKADEDDSTKKLSGAVFGLYADPDCNNLIQTITTNSYGEAVTDRLRCGSYYYVREITPPPGYNYDGTIHKVYVHYNQSRITLSDGTEAIPLYVDNEITPGFAAITKIDDEGKPVSGALFDFYRKSDNVKLETALKSSSNGFVVTKNAYDPGVYYFKETSAPSGYVADTTTKYEVEIEKSTASANLIYFLTYYADDAINPRVKSYAAIYKYDQNNKPLSGAVFSFYSSDGTLLESGLTSNSSGLVKTSKTYNPGEYYFIETKAPNGYKLDTTKCYVTIKMNATSTTFFADTLINPVNSSKIAVHKIDYYYGYSLEGARFGVYTDSACKTSAKDYIVTDETGYGETSITFEPGTYYLKELETPDGYSTSETIHIVTVSKTDSTNNVVVLEVDNTPYPQQIQVKKVNENNGIALEGAQFQVRKPAENLLDTIVLTDVFSSSNSGSGWRTKEWNTSSTKTITYTAEVSDSVGVDGSGAIKIDVTQVTGDARGRVYLNVKPDGYSDSLTPGEKYTFSCRVRTENIIPADGVAEYGAQITPIFVNTSGGVSSSSATESDAIDYNTDVSIENGFVYLSVDFTIPEYITVSGTQTDFSYLRLTLALRGATGTAYFDDIKLTSNEYCVWEKYTTTQSNTYMGDGILNMYKGTAATGISAATTQKVNIDDFVAGANYTASTYIKIDALTPYASGMTSYGVMLSVIFVPNSGSSIVTSTEYINDALGGNINDGYKYISLDVTAPEDLSAYSHCEFRIALITAKGDIYIKEPRLYLNNKYDNFDSYKKGSWGSTGSVTYTTEVSTDTFAFGGESLKIDVSALTVDKRGRAYYDVYGLTAGETYTLSAYIKTENLQKVDSATTYGAAIAGTVFKTDSSTSSYYSGYVNSANTAESQNSGFVRVSRNITMPTNIDYLRINLFVRGATGTAYFDEIRLEPKDTVLATITTNSSGIATYSNSVYAGEYELMEILAPDGYYFSNATHLVDIELQDTENYVNQFTFANEPITRYFSLVKYDSKVYTDAYVYYRQVSGATYVLCQAPTTGTKFATATTGDTPTVFVSTSTGEPYEFSSGYTYYLKETVAPYGYILDENWYKVTITDEGYEIYKSSGAAVAFDRLGNSADTIVVEDASIRGNVKITKNFYGDNENSKSAYFSVYDANTGYVCRFDQTPSYLGSVSPDKSGSASGAVSITFGKGETRTLYNLPVGEYYLEEITVSDGYIPYQGRIYFEIKPNSTGTACDVVNITVNNNEVLLWNTGGNGSNYFNPIAMVLIMPVPAMLGVYYCIRRRRKCYND